MKTIFIAGAWSSGTTAVAGALSELGVASFGPHFRTNDPHTQNSYELEPFRKVILSAVDERSVSIKTENREKLKMSLEKFRERLAAGEFGNWPDPQEKRVLLKMPLASICLPEIMEVFDPKVILVHRPLAEIERSRVRRRWPAVFGAKGAQIIMSHTLGALLDNRRSFYAVSYKDISTNKARVIEDIIYFCDLSHLKANKQKACDFIRGS